LKRKAFSAAVAVCTVAATLAGGGLSAANASVFVPLSADNVVHDSNQQQIIDVFNGINAFRASKGLSPVRFSVPISSVSQGWSDRMAASDTFYHNPDFTAGVPANWSAASEIIAARWDRVGQGLVDQWILSPSHNAIMSDPQHNTMGIGIAFSDMSDTGTDAVRYGMYGTANLFRYSRTPEGTYASPADYFAGKAPVTDPLVQASPQPPTFTQYDYTLPSVSGVTYTVNGIESPPGTKQATTYRTDISLLPEAGYVFPPGTVTEYSHIFDHLHPTPPVVKALPATFDAAARTYTIPAVTGLEYTVNGVVMAPGTYVVVDVNTVVRVQAQALAGYLLDTTSVTSWTHAFNPAMTAVTPAPPAFNQALGTYEVPAQDGVQYQVNGTSTPPGTYRAPAGTRTTITIMAVATNGYVLALGAPAQWSMVFGEPQTAISVTPTAPSFNAAAKTYTIPAKAGVSYTVNGLARAPGTYPGSGTVSVKALARTGYVLTGTSAWTHSFPAPAVKTGDLLAVDASGALWNYGNRTSTSRKALPGAGWASAKKIFASDWNADGFQDVLAQWKSGNLTVSYGTATGTLSPNKLIGTGWAAYELSIAKYNRSDRYPSVIAKDTAGRIWQYPNPNGTTPGPRVLKGTGWMSLQITVLDWDKDGNLDFIAKSPAGALLLYRTNGTGAFVKEPRKIIGTGWGGLLMHTVTGYAGAGTLGILAKDAKGGLYYYGTGKGTWLVRVPKGTGWLPMNIASS
jgi:uncharacterized protein YkwD